jgi:PHF5-like protein
MVRVLLVLDASSARKSHFCLSHSPVCDSYVRPETLVRICDECNFGTYGGRCIICGSPGMSVFQLMLVVMDSNVPLFRDI